MPRKPRRRTIKLEPLPPPMTTRSLTRANKNLSGNSAATGTNKATTTLYRPVTFKRHVVGKSASSRINDHKMPALAALKINCFVPPIGAKTDAPSASITATLVKIAPAPTPASPLDIESPPAPTISPSSKENDRPKRRKREPIKLPPEVVRARLSAKDLRRMKNRIAAMRLRERSQQDIRSLLEQRDHYRSRCEFLEIVVSGCKTCASLSAVEFGDIELLPAEPKKVKEETSDEELDEDYSTVLTEAECIVLDNVLHCSWLSYLHT